MSEKVKQGVKFEIKTVELRGIYLPGKLEYNEIEEEYYQFLQIRSLCTRTQNIKFKISKNDEEDFFETILDLFSTRELFKYGSFHRSSFPNFRSLSKNEKDFLIKNIAKVEAFFVNDELVAIGNSSKDLWLILETLGSSKKDMRLYEIDKVKEIFINKEKTKQQKEQEKLIDSLEKLIVNVDDEEKVKNIKNTIKIVNEVVNEVDLIISEISSN